MNETETKLVKAGITPTPVRMLVYNCLLNSSSPVSLSDIEFALESVDKSTISRTLSIFRTNHLVHIINDGSGSVKYELCRAHGHEHEDDTHVHFRCEKCGETICLPDVAIPRVILPEGFVGHEVSYIVTGICKDCETQM